MPFEVIARCSRLQRRARADGPQRPHRSLSSASRDGRRSRCGERHAGRVHLPPPPRPSAASSRCPRAALRTNPREKRAAGAGSARGSARSGAGAERSGRWGKMEGASFGAGRAGGAVDPLDFLKQPQTILRATAWVRRGGQRAVAGRGAAPVAACGARAVCSARVLCVRCAVCGAVQPAGTVQRAALWPLAPVGSSVGTGTVRRVADAVALQWFYPWCLSVREQGAAQKQRTFSSHPCSLCACVREMKSYSQPCPAPPVHPNGCYVCWSFPIREFCRARGNKRWDLCCSHSVKSLPIAAP